MIDWILLGAVSAVLTAEVLDALALRGLVRRCRTLQARPASGAGLLRWYAEGFDQSRRVTGWLRAGCVVLALTCWVGSGSLWLAVASLLLAGGAHWESCFSAALRRRFLRVVAR